MARLKQYLPLLHRSSIAPFVGLFGTCKGIITAFSTSEPGHGRQPSVIAPAIRKALVSTATRLSGWRFRLMFY